MAANLLVQLCPFIAAIVYSSSPGERAAVNAPSIISSGTTPTCRHCSWPCSSTSKKAGWPRNPYSVAQALPSSVMMLCRRKSIRSPYSPSSPFTMGRIWSHCGQGSENIQTNVGRSGAGSTKGWVMLLSLQATNNVPTISSKTHQVNRANS